MNAGKEALLIAIDMFQNTLALLMAIRVLRVRIRPFRVGFAAIFGAAAAFSARSICLSRIGGMMAWIPVAACMMHIASGMPWRGAAVLLACEGFLGGVVLALAGATGSLLLAHVLSAAVAGAIFVNTMRQGRVARSTHRVRVECVIGGRAYAFDAIVDSGNSLCDYLSQRPIIVAGMDVLGRGQIETIRTRLIFADTAGGRQMMRMIMPERTTIEDHKACLRVEAGLAFSPGLGKGAPALVPSTLMETQVNEMDRRRGN